MRQTQPDEEQAVANSPADGVFQSTATTRTSSPAEKPRADQSTITSRLKAYFQADVDPRWADLILISCFFVSGLVDSVAFTVWNCFASMQTGNTIFIALGVSNQPFNSAPYSWAKSLVAVACFLVGAISFAHLHRFLGPTRRYVLILSFGVQSMMIATAAILGTVGLVSTGIEKERVHHPETQTSTIEIKDVSWDDLAPLALLAFQSSGQIVASRMLKYNELPTVVLTSLYCDLMSDHRLFTVGITAHATRNRRIIAAILLLCGAISGGFAVINSIGLAGALWIAATMKACMTLAWVFWRPSATGASA